MSQTDLSWSVPVMRSGYAGRGLVYLAVAGLSLWAIWRGGSAQGTGSALQEIESGWGGTTLLVLIALGLLAYMVWRLVDAAWDLEAYGSDGEGTVARLGMVTTGVIHGALGIGALLIAFGTGGSGGGSSVAEGTAAVMAQPFGRWLVGLAGVATIGAGLYYLRKAWKEEYHKHLRANPATLRLNPVLKAGVAAQGVVVTIVGGFLVTAALQADASEAGGLGQTFGWLYGQPFGQVLVVLLCLGLLGFAFFCFVNAAYRIVPKVAGDDVETLGRKLRQKARTAT
ncbi:DUF1206 domain-containing protein [Histidinibacterium lentulum]|uniref:DUF1206 domain-containing protein n=1 Tax=Histidinibacterium lentulum TaxID=2480588 RepID=A0A3N2R9X5_9RHOB|nr:DUF1206 domain-containing protein [Histidinibacterium lentulum]ROU04215.1 DUF1206 domain-containing protein [Histidinibacterium lentulum]